MTSGAKKQSLLWRLPMFPRAGGAGPIAWVQVTTANRIGSGVLLGFIVIALSMSWPILLGGASIQLERFAGLIPALLFVMPQMIVFDFRRDIDRLDWLKSLPVSATSIAVGELLAPVLLASVLQMGILAAVAQFSSTVATYALWGLAFIPLANLLMFGLENLFFLQYPYRMPTGGMGTDFQAVVRMMLLMVVKSMLLMVVVLFVLSIAGAMYYLFGQSQAVFIGSAWLVACATGLAFVPAIAHAFRKFDPSVDTPA